MHTNMGLFFLLTTCPSAFGIPALGRSPIVKRDIKSDVCGTTDGAAASDLRNKANWNKYDIGTWFQNMVKPYAVDEWKYDGLTFTDVQQIVIHEMDNDSVGKCEEIASPGCVDTGYDWDLCNKTPEAHFVFFAIVHWANYLNALMEVLQNAEIYLQGNSYNLVGQFFTPGEDLTDLIVAINVIAGVAGVLAAQWSAFSALNGAATIISALLSLDTPPDPVTQADQISAVSATQFKNTVTALGKFFKITLTTLPDEANVRDPYNVDPSGMPMILKDGDFAQLPSTPPFSNSMLGLLGASQINSLWVQDKVFIVKISDKAYGGKACNAFPGMTACIDGVAYIIARWVFKGTIDLIEHSRLDPDNWYAMGAYNVGPHNNANHLKDYGGFTLEDVATDAWMTQQAHGFLWNNPNDVSINYLNTEPDVVDPKRLVYWSIPVCDIDAIIGPNKHLGPPEDQSGDDPITFWGACTCSQMKGWPDHYAQNSNGYVDADCQNKGWKDN